MIDTPWLRIKEAAEYAKVSKRTLRTWLAEGLRHSKIRNTVRIKSKWLDEFIEAHSEKVSIDETVNEVMKDFRKKT